MWPFGELTLLCWLLPSAAVNDIDFVDIFKLKHQCNVAGSA